MRPGLNRMVVRENTAYRVGRIAVDVFTVLQWLGTLLFLVLFFRSDPEKQGAAGLALLSLAVGSSIILAVAVLALRELAHAIFDIADCALLDRKGPGAVE